MGREGVDVSFCDGEVVVAYLFLVSLVTQNLYSLPIALLTCMSCM